MDLFLYISFFSFLLYYSPNAETIKYDVLLPRCYFVCNKADHFRNCGLYNGGVDNGGLILCINANRCKLIPAVVRIRGLLCG